MIAIIPARLGSTRIKEKNIIDFNNKPMIAYPIQECIKSGLFEDVYVSTESEKIKNIAIAYKAKVPFMRDLSLADNFTTTVDVLKDAYDKLVSLNLLKDDFAMIYPTTPLLSALHLQRAYKQFKEQNLDVLLSAIEYDFPIQRGYYLKDNKLEAIMPECMMKRSQDLDKAYHDAGQFYFYKYDFFKKIEQKKPINASLYILPKYRAIDLDEPCDVQIAKAYCKAIEELNLE